MNLSGKRLLQMILGLKLADIGIKKKQFLLFCSRFCVSLASPKILRLGKAQIILAFLSTLCIFAIK